MILLLVPALIALFLIRARWIAWQVDQYAFKTVWFCRRTKQSAETQAAMSEVWPGSHMLLELWRWDWRRYVVDQDLYDQMERVIAEDLKRPNIDLSFVFDSDSSPDEESQPQPPSDDPPTR